MKCPRDGTELIRGRQGGHRYHACPLCHGLLLQTTHMEAGVDQAAITIADTEPTPPGDLEAVVRSPVTGHPMTRKVSHGVTVDVCRGSGYVWLDHGEPERLLAKMVVAKSDDSIASRAWRFVDESLIIPVELVSGLFDGIAGGDDTAAADVVTESIGDGVGDATTEGVASASEGVGAAVGEVIVSGGELVIAGGGAAVEFLAEGAAAIANGL